MIICDFETLKISLSFSRIGTSYTTSRIFQQENITQPRQHNFFLLFTVSVIQGRLFSQLDCWALHGCLITFSLGLQQSATPARKFFAQIFIRPRKSPNLSLLRPLALNSVYTGTYFHAIPHYRYVISNILSYRIHERTISLRFLGHNLESSQTSSFHMQCLTWNQRGGGGVKSVSRGDCES
jgi:hypothetical protein